MKPWRTRPGTPPRPRRALRAEGRSRGATAPSEARPPPRGPRRAACIPRGAASSRLPAAHRTGNPGSLSVGPNPRVHSVNPRFYGQVRKLVGHSQIPRPPTRHESARPTATMRGPASPHSPGLAAPPGGGGLAGRSGGWCRCHLIALGGPLPPATQALGTRPPLTPLTITTCPLRPPTGSRATSRSLSRSAHARASMSMASLTSAASRGRATSAAGRVRRRRAEASHARAATTTRPTRRRGAARRAGPTRNTTTGGLPPW